ncbi:MAG: NAD(P)/FAD-dependent oxidoreductase [Deltaproteobacteria bacterium]|nr:NAD(P)/FAD-dependent oxidoreductase [Deltaproteobacteria bacterium]
MTQHFDVAVVGGQTSGIVAAALLAKRGRRVALFDHGEHTAFYRRKGLRLPLLPSLIPAFETSPVVQKVHGELGLSPDLRTSTAALKPSFQAVTPTHRIDIAADRAELLAELGQEFPALKDAVATFLERVSAIDAEISTFLAAAPALPQRGFFDRLRHRRILSSIAHLDQTVTKAELASLIPADHPLVDLFLTPLAFFAHLDTETPSLFAAARLIARYFNGVVGFNDRLGGMNAALWRAAKQAGVEIFRGAVVKSVTVSGARLTAATVDGVKGSVTADYFVGNTYGPFSEVLPQCRAQARYAIQEQAVRPSRSLMVLNLVVRKEVIPTSMAGAVFLLNGRRQPRGDDGVDPPLFVERFPARRGEPGPVRGTDTIEDVDHEVLCVACPVATAEVSRSPERLAVLKQQMIERVGRLVPFLRKYLIDASLPTETSSWDVESGDVAGRVDPWMLHPLFDPPARPMLGIAAQSTTTPFTNLFHCGYDVVPGLGIEGEYLAGIYAADLVTLRAKRNVKR